MPIEKKININGIKTNYKIAGSGPAILILHGWGASSDSWLRVQEILAGKGKGYKIIVPDFPGFGKSDNPVKVWNLENYADWLKIFLDKISQTENIFLLAHSFGGRIAIKYIEKYNPNLKALILCSPAGIAKRPKAKIAIFSFLSKIGNLIFSLPVLKPLRKLARKFVYFLAGTYDYQFIQSNIMKKSFENIISEDLNPLLSVIKTPTLILWGKKDKLVPVKYVFVFQEKIKNSQLKIFPDTGHSPHLEIPEKLSQTIINFVRSVRDVVPHRRDDVPHTD